MKRTLIVVGYGIVGLLVAVSLTAGAFAVAGADIAQPASPVGGLATPATVPLEPAPTSSPHEGGNTGDHHGGNGQPSPSASIDDRGGDTASGSGTGGGSGGSDDGSSSGSGSDSGSGSGDGSGSDDGSGSGSGSGSDD
jgi:hypothetical protein